MVLGKLPVPGRTTFWMILRQVPTALAAGAGGELFGYFYSRLSFLSSFSPLGDGPIKSEIVSQRAIKPKQPNGRVAVALKGAQ